MTLTFAVRLIMKMEAVKVVVQARSPVRKRGGSEKKLWTHSGRGSPKGGGCGRGKCPLPRFARKLLKTLIWQHKRINSLQTHVHVPKHSQPKNKQDEQFNFMRPSKVSCMPDMN